MARMARTQTNIQSAGGLASVSTQRFNHVVPEVAGASDGKDPFAGDLTNAFNNFFGKVSGAISSMQQADQFVRQEDAKKYATNMKQEAFAYGNRQSSLNQGMTRDQAMTTLQNDPNITEAQRNNTHFLTAYAQTVGSNTGNHLYADFKLAQAGQNPATFEANAAKFWQENYGQGTGDPTFDSYMQEAWTRNYENDRVESAKAVVTQQRALTNEAINTSVDLRVGQSDFGLTDISTTSDALRANNPALTPGTAMSMALGMYKNAAVAEGPRATQRFLALLHQQPSAGVTPEGEPVSGQSFAQQFPTQTAQIEMETEQLTNAYITRAGQERVRAVSTAFTQLMASDPDEAAQLQNLATFKQTQLAALESQPGMGTAYETLRKQIETKENELINYGVGMNRMDALAAGQVSGGLDATETKKYASEWLQREANLITGNPNMGDAAVSERAGTFLKHVYDNFGTAALDGDTKQMILRGVMSEDPAAAARTVQALQVMDPSGRIGRALLADDSMALAKFNAMTNGGVPTGDTSMTTSAVRFSTQTQAGVELINRAGGIRKFLSGQTDAAKANTYFDDNFGASARADALDAAQGNRHWFTTPSLGAAVDKAMQDNIEAVTAERAGRGASIDDHEGILREAAQRTSSGVMYDNGVYSLITETPAIRRDAENKLIIPLGNAIRNPSTGAAEDTVETMRNDIELVTTAMSNLTDANGNTFSDMYYESPRDLAEINGRLLFNGATRSVVSLDVGVPLTMQEQFREDGSRRGWFSRWGTDNIQLTGDPARDQILVNRYINPAISLRPVRTMVNDGQGNVSSQVVSYQMVLTPRLTGTTKMTEAELQEAIIKDPRNAQAHFDELINRYEGMNIAP